MHLGVMSRMYVVLSSRRRHTRCALVTGVQTCALPIWPKNAIPTKKVTPTITMAVHDRLVRLAKIGIYGSSPAEVARHLIVSGLDDLTKTGVLPNDHQTTG